MKIGVLDTDGKFDNEFFTGKKLKIVRDEKWNTNELNDMEFTHGEYVCSHILKENPTAEIILIPIINSRMKCSVQDLIDGLELLINYSVDMINLSIGDEYKNHKELEEICQKAYNKGILIVAAHSNREVDATYPAQFPFVLGVSCTDEEDPTKILNYEVEKNEIIFSSSYFSIYHLGIPKLLPGNSFACARITGLLSHHKNTYRSFLKQFSDTIFNCYYHYPTLKQKRCLFFTNRKNDLLEQRFIKEVTNTVECVDFLNIIRFKDVTPDRWDILYIDHSNYLEILPYKTIIKRLAISEGNKQFVLRFPLYNINERINLYKKNKIIIYQFFI